MDNLTAEHGPTLKPDWEIRADILDQLWWDSFVDSEDVNVRVENGIATLTGEVDTWAERSAAEHDAYDGGAKDVRNNLIVRYRHWDPYPAYDYPLYPFGY